MPTFLSFQANAWDGPTEINQFTIQANGNVGIGTPGPGTRRSACTETQFSYSGRGPPGSGAARSPPPSGGGWRARSAPVGPNGSLLTRHASTSHRTRSHGGIGVYDADGNDQAYHAGRPRRNRATWWPMSRASACRTPTSPKTDIVYAAIEESPEAAGVCSGVPGRLVRRRRDGPAARNTSSASPAIGA